MQGTLIAALSLNRVPNNNVVYGTYTLDLTVFILTLAAVHYHDHML